MRNEYYISIFRQVNKAIEKYICKCFKMPQSNSFIVNTEINGSL